MVIKESCNFLWALLFYMMKWPILLLSVLALTTHWTFKNKKSPENKLFFNNFYFGGHRGSNTKEPENTISSMKQAKLEGADLVEFDVSLTKDGVAVLLHDNTLDRTTNKTGLIRNILFADLKDCDTAPKFFVNNNIKIIVDPAIPRPVPTLEEMVVWAKANGIKMFFDIKDPDELMRHILENLFKKYDLYDIGLICSFYPTIVYRIKRDNPKILTAITWRRWAFSYQDVQSKIPRYKSWLIQRIAELWDTINFCSLKTWLPSFLAVDMVLTERAEISERYVRKQEAAGRRVCAWTVNDLNEMRWMRKVLNIPFLTDMPYLVQEI